MIKKIMKHRHLWHADHFFREMHVVLGIGYWAGVPPPRPYTITTWHFPTGGSVTHGGWGLLRSLRLRTKHTTWYLASGVGAVFE